MELCRLGGIVGIEAAGQKVRSVDVGQQGPVEAIPCPAGAVVEQDVIGPALLGLADIVFADDGKALMTGTCSDCRTASIMASSS